MKPILRSLRGLAARAVNYFGKGGGGFFSSAFRLLSGSNRDWSKDAGPRYDNSAVFSVIQYLTRQITGEPRLIVQKQRMTNQGKAEWTEDASHELPRLVKRGTIMGSDQLLGGLIVSAVVSGDGYWIKDRALNGKLTGFIFVPHWQMAPIRNRPSPFGDRMADGTHLVTFYEFKNPDGTKIPFSVEDVVHFRWGVDPARPEHGLSPLFAALREIVTDNEAATLGAALLANAGIPGVAISPKEKVEDDLTPEQREQLNTKFARRVTGDQAGTPFIAPFPCDYTVIGFSPDKLVLDKTRAMAVTRILAPFGIDPMVLGFPSEQKTYSNFEEALEHAWRSACKPLLRLIAEALYEQVLLVDFPVNADGCRVYWDLSEVPEEQDDIDKEADRLRKLFMADAITRSDLRAGLGYDVDAARDDVFYSAQKPVATPVPANDPAAVKKALASAARASIPALKAAEALIDA